MMPGGGKQKSATLILFNDALLLADRTTFGSKLSVLNWFLPEAVEGARPIDPPGTLHVRRAGGAKDAHSGETLVMVVSPPAEADAWLADLRRVSMLHAARDHSAQQSSMAKGGISGCSSGDAVHEAQKPLSKAAAAAAAKGSGIMAGWLEKKGGGGADGAARNWAKGGRRNWKRRWMVVTNTQYISWFESEKCKELKGSLALIGAQVSKSEKPGGFWILTNNRSLELVAESDEVANRWVEVLQGTANQLPKSMKERALPSTTTTQGEGASSSRKGSSGGEASGAGHDAVSPTSPRGPSSPVASLGLRVRVLWEYVGERHDDLSLNPGEIIDVVSAEGDWWVGRIGERYGTFPSNYCEPVPSSPPPQSAVTAHAAAATSGGTTSPWGPPPGSRMYGAPRADSGHHGLMSDSL
jgi:hypothetical protein